MTSVNDPVVIYELKQDRKNKPVLWTWSSEIRSRSFCLKMKPQRHKLFLLWSNNVTSVKGQLIAPEEILLITVVAIRTEDCHREDSISVLVKPTSRPTLAPFCVKSTGSITFNDRLWGHHLIPNGHDENQIPLPDMTWSVKRHGQIYTASTTPLTHDIWYTLPDLQIWNQINHFFHMKKLLKVMVWKGPFDSQMQNLCVLRHHFLNYKIFTNDL